jgi:N-acetylmuramoyl-L-alanine amidase
VKEVRFWSLGDVTRIAIEVSADFKYRHDRLPDPDRIFFDIEDARPVMADKKIFVIPVGDSLLKQIRVAETQPGVTRVVLDVEERNPPVQFTASQLSSPSRLIVELRSMDRPSPPAVSSVTGSAALPDAPVEAKPASRKFLPPPDGEVSALDLKPPVIAPLAASIAGSPRPPSSSGVRVNLPAYAGPAQVDAKATAPKGSAAPQALPAKRNANGEESLTRVLGLKLGRVVIDPGHGGQDEGTHGPTGLTEKEVVLDIAKRLGALLEQRLNTEVVYTRDDDTFIPLEDRTRIANEHKADLFLSIHANSSPVRGVSGVESYYLNFTTSRTALEVAARENATAQSSIFDLQQVLQKIAVKDKIDESREFATRIQSSLFAVSARGNPAVKNRGVKKAPFVVLIGASMPSVLAEIGFLTNLNDEALLRNSAHRQKIAEALYRGIASYADTLSHFAVAQRE